MLGCAKGRLNDAEMGSDIKPEPKELALSYAKVA